jgi:excisionase family DNA binding protein
MDNLITVLNLSKQELNEIVCNALKEALKSPIDSKKSDRLLSRYDTAEYLKISLPTLDKLTQQGVLIAYRTGRKKMYVESEINLAIKKFNAGNR